MESPAHTAFTIRLEEKFGDHGLIAVVVCEMNEARFEIDTWLMSCRVLKREVEEETVAEIVRLARRRGAERIRGKYIPTAKNGMVRDLFPRMGFKAIGERDGQLEFEADPQAWEPARTHIAIARRAYE
jgi:FkbH-like protein